MNTPHSRCAVPPGPLSGLLTLAALSSMALLGGCSSKAPAPAAPAAAGAAAHGRALRLAVRWDDGRALDDATRLALSEQATASLGRPVAAIPILDPDALEGALQAGQVDLVLAPTPVVARAAGPEPATASSDEGVDEAAATPPGHGLELLAVASDRATAIAQMGDEAAPTVADLADQSLAIGVRWSASSHVFGLKALAHAVDDESGGTRRIAQKPVHTRGDDDVREFVGRGRVAAGLVSATRWERWVAEGAVDPSQLVAVWTSDPFPAMALAARRDLAETMRPIVSAALQGGPITWPGLDVPLAPTTLDDDALGQARAALRP